MQIPMGNFGQTVAQPAGAISVPRQDVSSGLGAIDSVGSQIAGEDASKTADLQHQQETAKASLSMATIQNGYKDAHDQVQRGVIDGSIPLDQAQVEFQKRADAVRSANMEGLTQQHADMMAGPLATVGGDLSRSIGVTVYKQQQSQTAATVDQFGEQLQRQAPIEGPKWVAQKYNDLLDSSGPAAGLSPEQIGLKKQAFQEKTTFGYYDGKASAAYAAQDLPGLTDTLHEVLGPEGQVLDPTKRAQLTHTLVGYQSSLLAQKSRAEDAAARAQEARERDAATAYDAAWKLFSSGKTFDAPTIQNLSAETAGTSMAGPASILLHNQAPAAGFAGKSAPDRAAILEGMRSNAANPAVGTSPDKEKFYQALDTMDKSITAEVNDNPWKAAEDHGVIDKATAMPAGGAGDNLALLDQRMQSISKVEAYAGHKVSPLQPAEAAQLSQNLQAATPEHAAVVLSQIGKMVQDSDRIAAIGKQLDDRGGVMGLAMAYAGDQTEKGQLVSELVLRGAQMTKQRTSQEDTSKAANWRGTIAGEIQGAYANQQVTDKAIDAATHIAVALNGDTDTAIKYATGGLTEHGTGKVPLPYGMDENTFNQRLNATTADQLASSTPGGIPGGFVISGRTQIPVATFLRQIPDATLIHAGQGRYAVKAGTSLVTNAAGQYVILGVQ